MNKWLLSLHMLSASWLLQASLAGGSYAAIVVKGVVQRRI
jgi:hypothetical protein